MSSVLVEYPEGLPAPTVGEVKPTERRAVSSVGQMRNFRSIQRDRHGTRTVAFTFTPEQAAIFREWWVEWLQLGGGWFAANWPLPWSRGPNVFRFKDPPQWSLIGGRLDGQGYWQVKANCEIRGRGMLPTAEVMYLTSTPYPVFFNDAIGLPISVAVNARESLYKMPIDTVGIEIAADISVRDIHRQFIIAEDLSVSIAADISARATETKQEMVEAIGLGIGANISARNAVVKHTIKPESINLSIGASFNAA